MNQPIKYRKLGDTSWLTDGTLVDGLNGNLAIKKDDGTYVTQDRNGDLRSSTTIGAWEGSFQLMNNVNALKSTPNVVTYVVEICER